ncbi:allantoate deiminase [Rhodobacter sp. JA431]|uniref:allantoate amidohydrolase n=1 Tax=Rhodobacter sp. JA431 TaxID=570013 RepID=UPI000BD58130|nr:allantoate amidohydrolase [Rhodobacter sp. JA431]SOC10437.1 allantoate deiminase [Rhodobacter sp. JA431]
MSALAERTLARLAELAAITAEPGKMTRLAFSPEMRAANDLVAGWLREAGATSVRMDAAGNLIGRWGGPGPALALGSHLDTVRDGGIYDGPLGVLAAIAAMEALQMAGEALPFPVEILCFGDEEGTRFGTSLAGSLSLAGGHREGGLALCDADGITARQALSDFGLDPDRIGEAAADPRAYFGYLELHIEQGPVLEQAGVPFGVVSGIAGATRGRILVTGQAGHAGTVPMALRQDALTGAAEIILAIERAAGPDVVATVGQCTVHPGGTNTIPGAVELSLDLRALENDKRAAACAQIQHEIAQIAKRRGLSAALDITSQSDSSACAPQLMASLSRATERVMGTAPPDLPSGAGHDGAHMKMICDYGMLFMRCRGGISHHPDEAIDAQDVAPAIAILAETLRDLAHHRTA